VQFEAKSDNSKTKPLRVGVIFWAPGDGLGLEICGILENLGHKAIDFFHNAKLPENLDIVFTSGPFGSLVPVASQLLAIPPNGRPDFIWWLTEQLPNPAIPRWILHWGGFVRSQAERVAYRERGNGEWRPSPSLRWLTAKAHRFRYFGDLCWLEQEGILSAVVTSSPWRADYLRANGFDPYVPPSPSYRPELGTAMSLERDIPVLWLGKTATRRRKYQLQRVRRDLHARGIEMMVVDGVENPYIFGDERTKLLNRTKILVNLLRTKWDNHAMRYALAAQNRCLLVTEPTLPHTSFQPGVHIVEAPIARMADDICYYLSHEEERQRITERAYQLIKENSREEIVGRLLEHVTLMRHNNSGISKNSTPVRSHPR
jgi:hypothetical protein